jgi:hypothetical protein
VVAMMAWQPRFSIFSQFQGLILLSDGEVSGTLQISEVTEPFQVNRANLRLHHGILPPLPCSSQLIP